MGCVREVLIITAALSIQDPRERPADAREAADAMHARFAEPGSDFLTLVNLWDYLREQQRELSGSAFRRMCRREYLHYLRVREWQDVQGQLRQAARDWLVPAPADRSSRDRRPGWPARAPRDRRAAETRRRGRAPVPGRPRRPGAHVAAGRPALAHRHAGRRDSRLRREAARAGRVRRRARREVRDLP